MHPFNRQHGSRLRPRTSPDRHGRLSPDDRRLDDSLLDADLFPSKTAGSSPLAARRSLPHDQDILRAKEQVLVGSLSRGSCCEDKDNSQRLGPNTQDMFEVLRTASRARAGSNAQPNHFGSNLFNLVANITLKVDGCKGEFTPLTCASYSEDKPDITNSGDKNTDINTSEEIFKEMENDKKSSVKGICCSHYGDYNFNKEGQEMTDDNRGAQECITVPLNPSCSGCMRETELESSSKECSSSSSNVEPHHHQFSDNEISSENASSV
ncbi:uncharacterized protein LOC134542693 [Bacillus rossius redtenbacheri]|uniref:uncharacterized protein LOC134542693 n=1 Tax=Bacillus rossius redtenbacheri TaxID=93214 RepID=UPI002FDE579E